MTDQTKLWNVVDDNDSVIEGPLALSAAESALTRCLNEDIDAYLSEASKSQSKNISSNAEGNLAVIWNALHGYREDCISEDHDQWDEITTAMAWIQEDLSSTK